MDDMTSQLEDLQQQLTTLKRRFDQLRDDYADQLASLRGRITAKERWDRTPSKPDDLKPASITDILEGLTPTERDLLKRMLGTTSSPPTSGESVIR